MNLSRTSLLILVPMVLTLAQAGSSFAAGTVVKVSLWDKGPDAMDMLGKGTSWAMGAVPKGAPKPPMGIDIEPKEVAAGEVTFQVTNASKDAVHEMIVAPVKDTAQPMRYIQTEERVDEDAAKDLGEVSELEPQTSGSLTVTMKPGEYILYCNVAGHYVLGMWTLITVKP